MVRVQQQSTRQNHRFSRNNRPSLREWFYGLYVISPVTGLSCHRRSSDSLESSNLSASVGAPGPHDFAVRDTNIRLL